MTTSDKMKTPIAGQGNGGSNGIEKHDNNSVNIIESAPENQDAAIIVTDDISEDALAFLQSEGAVFDAETYATAASYSRQYQKFQLTSDYIEKVLSFIHPNDLTRDDWLRVTFSIRALETEHGLDLYDVWDRWSDDFSNRDPNADNATWKSAAGPRNISGGTLFHYAAQSGWSSDRTDIPLREVSADEVRARKAREKERQAETAALAELKQQLCRKLWENASATSEISKRYFRGRGNLFVPDGVFRESQQTIWASGELASVKYTNIVSQIRDFETGAPIGLHLNAVQPATTNLLPTSIWSVSNVKFENGKSKRLTPGSSGGYIDLVSTDSRTLVVAEGVETALSALNLPLGLDNPNIRALVNDGNFRKMPPLPEIDQLYILADIEESGAGMKAARTLASNWAAVGKDVRIVTPILKPNTTKRDLNDVAQDLVRFKREAEEGIDYAIELYVEPTSSPKHEDDTSAATQLDEQRDTNVRLTDFYAFAPKNQFIHKPSGSLWPAKSVDSRIPPISLGGKKKIKPSDWLSANRSVESITWAPGEPELIKGKLFVHSGWVDHPASNTYNDYKPAILRVGNAGGAGKWLDHIHAIYPDGAERIISFFAHRVQKPGEKINYILNLGGPPKQGKDTILEPVMHAVGRHNCAETTPKFMLGLPYNGYERSVIMRISEIHDLGEHSRFELHEHLKIIAAAPPNVVTINDKYTPIYHIGNVTGIITTTNHKHALYLPPDDRRNECWWVFALADEFTERYWNGMYAWYDSEGYDNVAACLRDWDLSKFNPKAAPERTAWFWEIVEAGRDSEESELSDVIDRLSNKDAFTVQDLVNLCMGSGLADWLQDRKHRRTVGHRLEKCGYGAVRNPDVKDGLWVVMGERRVIYVRNQMAENKRLTACRDYLTASDIF